LIISAQETKFKVKSNRGCLKEISLENRFLFWLLNQLGAYHQSMRRGSSKMANENERK